MSTPSSMGGKEPMSAEEWYREGFVFAQSQLREYEDKFHRIFEKMKLPCLLQEMSDRISEEIHTLEGVSVRLFVGVSACMGGLSSWIPPLGSDPLPCPHPGRYTQPQPRESLHQAVSQLRYAAKELMIVQDFYCETWRLAASRDRDVMDTVVAAHQYVKCLQRKVDHLASASAELQHMQHSVEEIHRAAHSLHATTTISSHATPELSTECAAEKAASPTSSLVRETSPTPAPEATATDGFLYRIFCKLFGGVGSSRVGTAEVQMEESCDVPAPVLRDPVELLESYIPRPVPGMTPRLVPMESYYPLVVQPPPPPPPPPSSLCSGTRMQESVLCGVHGGGRASDDEDMEEDRTSFGALSIPWTSTISFEAPPGQHQRLPFTVLGASCSSSSVTQSSNGSTCFSSRRNSECSISDGHSPYHSSRPAASTPIVVTASCSSCGFVHSNTPPSTLPPSRWPLGRPHLSGRVHRRRSWLLQVLHPMFNVLGSLWRRLVLCQHCEEIGGSGSPACRPAAAAATTTTTTTTTTTITTTTSSSSPTSTTSAAAGVPCCGEVSHSSGSWGAKRLSSCRFVGGPFFQSQHRRLFAGSSMPWQSPPLSSAAAAPAAATTSPTKGHFRQHPPPRTNRSPHSRRLPSSLDTVEGVGFLDSLFQMDLDDGQDFLLYDDSSCLSWIDHCLWP